MRSLWKWVGVPIVIVLAAGVSPPGSVAKEVLALADGRVETGWLAPATEKEANAPALDISDADYYRLHNQKLRLREAYARLVDNGPATASVPDLPEGEETSITDPGDGASLEAGEDPDFPGVPSTLVIPRNVPNPRANGALGSLLAEPAAANNGRLLFATGNLRHAEHSPDGGINWYDNPMPGGPADAPVQLGDQYVLIDDPSRVVIHSALYVNAGTINNGIIRIFIRRTISAGVVPAPANCFYNLDPGGAANNLVPDYPQIGLTKRFVYLAINAVGAGGGFARMYRFGLDQMLNCVTTPFTTYTQLFSAFGQRVWTPVGGTNDAEVMYWGQHNNSTTFRVFSWSETAAAPVIADRVVAATNFVNPDCRGGTNNVDWIERTTAWSIIGFTHKGTLSRGRLHFFWNAGAAPPGITQGHVRSVVFAESGLGILAQPVVFNNGLCFGLPNVSANKRGDVGIMIGAGGRAGGGGPAVTAYVGLDDEFTAGFSFVTVSPACIGTHNPSRHGDYWSVAPHEPDEKFFSATCWALNGGTALANVNSRYVEFGRNVAIRAYNAHANQTPVQ